MSITSRALRLHDKHTFAELGAMLDDIKADPASREGAKGLFIYNDKAIRKMADIGWAMYWHRRPRGNTHMQPGTPDKGRLW